MAAPTELEKVLILDDDPTGRFVLQRVVKDLGLAVVTAETIAQAQALTGEHALSFALIDKNLNRENGLEFLAWLRAAQPGCAAIMVTAYGSVETTVEALRLGAADFVLKPFELDLLAHRLRLQLERQRLLRDTAAARDRLVASDRLVALGTLSASIVHEVSSPLTAVLMGVENLAAELGPALTPGAAGVLAELRGKILQVSEVIRNVRSFARNDTGQLVFTELAPALEAALSLADGTIRYRARVVRELGPVPPVLATHSRLTQVFLNLLVNAAHALPERASGSSEIRVRLFTGEGGEARVAIIDNGAGIPDTVKAQLFSPFVTTKPEGVGTGLGLWICKRIIEGLGGRLELESAVGRGTTVRVIIPAAISTPVPE